MSQLKKLITEIHRRSLWQILLVYLGVSWGLLEAAALFRDEFGLPHWLVSAALGLLIAGLAVLLVLAFVPEPSTSAGEPREQRLTGFRRRHLLTWRRAATIFVVALAAWGVVATGWLLLGRTESASHLERPSIAVLPLENRSGLEEDRYFTDGIHDEILTQLYKISGLSVRGRTSVMEYRDSPKNLRQIGTELDARYLMEGGVQRAGETVRINVQLVDSETDEHVFADTYDRELSLENLLAVQREVALRIADALEATLTAEEREQIEKVPTENPEAYDYYLRGIEYLDRPGIRPENYRNAQRMLELAVELDPRFALAHARLSRLHAAAHEWGIDRSEERLRQARAAAERALEIDPDLSSGHYALGYCYFAVRDYEAALEEVAIAERGRPGSWLRAMILKRQGKWEEALASLEQALALSPREPLLLTNLGYTYVSLRRYEEAEIYFDRALALQPDAVETALSKALVPGFGRGDMGPLRTFLAGIPAGVDPWGLVTFVRWYVEYFDRDYAAALEVLSRSEFDYVEFEGPGGSGSGSSAPRTLLMGICYAHLGETELAAATADSARRDLEARLVERPEDPRLHQSLSQAHALLGQREEAVRAAQRAVELLPISEDAENGPNYVLNLANIHAWFGEVDAAVEQFDRYLSVPAPRSIESVRSTRPSIRSATTRASRHLCDATDST